MKNKTITGDSNTLGKDKINIDQSKVNMDRGTGPSKRYH